MGYSAFTVCSARVIRAGHCSTAVMATVFCGTALGLGPVWLLFPTGWILTLRGAGVVMFIGLVATSGAYCLYGFGLRHTPSSTAAVLVLAEPATAAALAVALLGQHLGLLGATGLTAVFIALAMAAVRTRHPPRPGLVAQRIGPRHARPAAPSPAHSIDLAGMTVTEHRSHTAALLGTVGTVEFSVDTWQRLEVEAANRGVHPRQLIADLVDIALSAQK